MKYVLVGAGGFVAGGVALYTAFWLYLLKNNPYG